MRRTLTILTAALLATGLAACSSSSPSPTPTSTSASTACQNVKSGSTSDSVKVAGDFRATPSVTMPKPLTASDLQRTVVIKGHGSEVKGGDTIDIGLAAYNGTTGKQITPSAGFGNTATQTVQVDDKAFVPGLVRAVECLPIGTRVVLTSPAKQAFGNADISKLSLTDKDSVVFIADLVDKVTMHATGSPVAPTAGFPTVTLKSSGEPTITVPKTAPPTATKIAVLKQGNGDTVQANDTVTLQYKGVLWRDGSMFDSSWSHGAPLTNAASQFVPGFTKAIVGQKVGSQIIAVIPPTDGYGTQGSGPIKGTDTMVFVIDILKTSR